VAVLLVNTSAREVIAEYAVDSAPIRSHLKTDRFGVEDVDKAKPPEDLSALADSVGKDVESQITRAADEAEAAPEEADHLEEAMAEEKKQEAAKTPEGMYEEGRFTYEDNTLRLKIRPYDYRLLVIRPDKGPAPER
jgi:hypothetical protein